MSHATPRRGATSCQLLLTRARLTPGVPGLRGRPVVAAAAVQKFVPGTNTTPLQASFGCSVASVELQSAKLKEAIWLFASYGSRNSDQRRPYVTVTFGRI